MEFMQQRHAIHTRHANVADNDTGKVGGQCGQGCFGGLKTVGRISGKFKGLAGGDAQMRFVVNHHDRQRRRLMHRKQSPGLPAEREREGV
eukprot:15795-Eustigmatos_ZCMA.PRE.1